MPFLCTDVPCALICLVPLCRVTALDTWGSRVGWHTRDTGPGRGVVLVPHGLGPTCWLYRCVSSGAACAAAQGEAGVSGAGRTPPTPPHPTGVVRLKPDDVLKPCTIWVVSTQGVSGVMMQRACRHGNLKETLQWDLGWGWCWTQQFSGTSFWGEEREVGKNLEDFNKMEPFKKKKGAGLPW